MMYAFHATINYIARLSVHLNFMALLLHLDKVNSGCSESTMCVAVS